jgi:glycosyltransferase involved in cell wall biosynthesis
MEGPLVSVVVPAFNAAPTIGSTLDSITRQTYRRLDVVIVDDGSTDETNSVVRRFCLSDLRMRLIEQPNSGVAAARNAGIRASKGDFVAFIDADDLWHPTKIERQLRALLEQGPDVALVYSPFRVIDGEGNVIASARRQRASGWVLDRHLKTNIVGNGSSILVRKSVLHEFGGFDPWLRQQGAEGCEDLLLQLRIASRYQFCEVPEYLVAYRRHGGSMSADRDRMIRSGMLAIRRALSECAAPARSTRGVLARYEWKRLKLAVRKGDRNEASAMLRALCSTPEIILYALWKDMVAFTAVQIRRRVERLARILFKGNNPPRRRHFYDYSPS